MPKHQQPIHASAELIAEQRQRLQRPIASSQVPPDEIDLAGCTSKDGVLDYAVGVHPLELEDRELGGRRGDHRVRAAVREGGVRGIVGEERERRGRGAVGREGAPAGASR